jgi:hypothetical protein
MLTAQTPTLLLATGHQLPGQQHHCPAEPLLVCYCPPAAYTQRVQPDTLCAIFAQENQYKVLKSHHIHKAHMDAYCARCGWASRRSGSTLQRVVSAVSPGREPAASSQHLSGPTSHHLSHHSHLSSCSTAAGQPSGGCIQGSSSDSTGDLCTHCCSCTRPVCRVCPCGQVPGWSGPAATAAVHLTYQIAHLLLSLPALSAVKSGTCLVRTFSTEQRQRMELCSYICALPVPAAPPAVSVLSAYLSAVCCLSAMSVLVLRYLSGEDLLALCGEVDFPPCLMVRRMLEGMMGLSKQVGGRVGSGGCVGRQGVRGTRVVRRA